MKFLIKQNSTLPKLELNFIGESRNGYKENIKISSNFHVAFSMFEKHTKKYYIVNSEAEIIYKEEGFVVSYQFNEKDTLTKGEYIGYFSISNNNVIIKLPLKETLNIDVLESVSDPSTCCRKNRTTLLVK
jgi:hypothetical protein